VDNIVKPILDALTGVVYSDDFLIAQSLVSRVEVDREDYTIADQWASAESFADLTDLLTNSAVNYIIYIEIGHIDRNRIVFGPIDGGRK
jgi:hypothetical protein